MFYAYDPVQKKSYQGTQSACTYEDECLQDEVGLILVLVLVVLTTLLLTYIFLKHCCYFDDE